MLIRCREAKLTDRPNGSRVTRRGGRAVIRGVKVIGLESENTDALGRRIVYSPKALKAAIPLYEGVRVNVDHPSRDNPTAERSYRDRIGKLRNVRFLEGKGLYADLWVNEGHNLAGQLLNDAEHEPDSLGLSHNAEGNGGAKTTPQGEIQLIEAITAVHSVDLVADPATTTSLFESRSRRLMEARMDREAILATLARMRDAVEGASDDAMAMEAVAMGAKELMAATGEGESMQEGEGGEPNPDDLPLQEEEGNSEDSKPLQEAEGEEQQLQEMEQEELKESRRRGKSSTALLESKVARLEAENRKAKREALVSTVLMESKLPKGAVTPLFRQQLLEARDDKTVRALVEDRARLAHSQTPTSYGSGGGGIKSSDDFMRALRGE